MSVASKAPSKKKVKSTPVKKKPAAKAAARPVSKSATKAARATASKGGGKKAATKKPAAKKPASKKAVKKPPSPAKKASPAAKKPAPAAKKPAPAKAPAKAAAAKPAAPRKFKGTPKTRLAALMEKLDRLYGVVQTPETESALEKAVYLVVREGSTENLTSKAMTSLSEEFVDWNDVRLSRPSELARLMCGSSKASAIRRFVERGNRVREMIDQIYNDRNEPSLEFLLEEKARAQLEFLEDLDDLGIHNAYALVQWLSGDSKLALVSPEMAKVCQAFGITESAAVAKVRKEVSQLCAQDQLLSVQAHLNQLGQLEADEWPSSLKELLD
jgi:endonuclease III